MSMNPMHLAVNLQANMRLTFVFYDAFKSLCVGMKYVNMLILYCTYSMPLSN